MYLISTIHVKHKFKNNEEMRLDQKLFYGQLVPVLSAMSMSGCRFNDTSQYFTLAEKQSWQLRHEMRGRTKEGS